MGDVFTREALAIEVGQRLCAADVVAALERLRRSRGHPETLRCDNVLNAIAAESFGNEHPVGARLRVDDVKEQVLHNPVVFGSASGGLA